jgi:reductive dehalogenase
MVTDLPLTPTRPIDAGMRRFCYDCKKCAEDCPSLSLMFDKEPSWEHPTAPLAMNAALQANEDMLGDYASWPWNVTGIKAWWLDVPTCVMCKACMAACVFSKLNSASIHNIVKATASITPIFNGFFRTMDDVFGYGIKNPEEFWELNLPSYGIDTTWGATRY